jgi:hypothetical protein
MEAMNAFITKIETNILNPIITLLALAAFIIFAWGVAEFILGAGDAAKRDTGKKHMIWGIVGLVIMFGAKVIVTILGNIVGAPASTGVGT